MNKTQSIAGGNRMRKAYGENPGETCYYCCNYQKKDKHDNDHLVCIAYDSNGEWDPSERACGLFNIPFRGLRPRRREIIEFYQKARPNNLNEGQDSLF